MRYTVVIGRKNEPAFTFPIDMPDSIIDLEEELEGVLAIASGRFSELYRNTHPDYVNDITNIDVVVYKEQFSTNLGRIT